MADGQGGLRKKSVEECRCGRMDKTDTLCRGPYGFEEKGKAVVLRPKSGETCEAIVLDGCVFPHSDPDPRCDGAFLWSGATRKAVVLIELKGANHIAKAFEQLAYVRYERAEYQDLCDRLKDTARERIDEVAFIITNGSMDKPARERLEDHYRIRVKEVIHSEPTRPTPDIRDRLR